MKRKPKLGSIYQRGGVWWLKYYRNGKSYRESSKSELYGDAERLLKRRLGEIVTGRFAGLGPERIRFRDLAQEVLADYSDNDRSSRGDVERRLRLHLLPALGDVRAADLGTGHVKQYAAARRKEEAANATINRELAIIKRAFHLAAHSDPPKVVRVPHIPMLEENNVRKGFLEHKAYLALRDHLPEEIRPLFVVGYYTGARIGELRSLKWHQVDLEANHIMLAPGTTKNKEGRTLTIYGEMRHWLLIEKEIRDAKWPDCAYVFHRGGQPVRDFRATWAASCTLAGAPGLLFHDLRRSAVRNMVRAGIPEKVAMQISGHKTRSIFDRYNIVSERDLAEAALKMERHIAAMGTVTGTTQDSEGKENARNSRKLLV